MVIKVNTWPSHRHDFVAKCLPEAERQRATGPKDTIGAILSQGPKFMMDKDTETSSSYQQREPPVSFRSVVLEKRKWKR
ncbi:unnamed protein product [Macrosiphum euphorbiae]|uniref:Uncharacterized protein n=1 Tax=Macrosiphum euphorbiae TaxID=13131 RepID=A0AAV0WHM5_9HEMI|nr:unnamed protein product [Macrosiphum euphorbiae]